MLMNFRILLSFSGAFSIATTAWFVAVRLFQTLRPLKEVVSRFACWIPPDNGWFKINTDAGLDSSHNCVGLRVVIRDCKGLVILLGMKRLDGLNFSGCC
ncbi:hypothetical protein ACOSQ3_030630 [Xanthoceras sorbifolium]